MKKKPFHSREGGPELKTSLYETVASELIRLLEAGTAPWQKPWAPGELPFNPVSGNRYKGINALHLSSQGRKDPRWLTYKQAQEIGAQVQEGQKATTIVYWVFSEEQFRTDAKGKTVLDEKGKPLKETVRLERPKMLHAAVFNAEQIDGMPALHKKELAWSPIKKAEELLASSGAKIQHETGDRSYYRLGDDTIRMPLKEQFADSAGYYSRALHEVAHWTGHPSRLAREIDHPYGSEGYAREELRAEIASMLFGQEIGLGYDSKQHAAYVGEWIKLLQDDPLEIFRAAADAEKAQSYIMSFALDQRQTQTPAQKEGELEPNETYRNELSRLLALSSLAPADYRPSESVRDSTQVAVLLDSKPLILCGHYADNRSFIVATDLAKSSSLPGLLNVDPSSLAVGAVPGSQIKWRDTERAIVAKASDKGADGTDADRLLAIVLDDSNALAANLCATAETARMIDPSAPKMLDDGITLPSLARGEATGHGNAAIARRVSQEIRLARRWTNAAWDSIARNSVATDVDSSLKALALSDGVGFDKVRPILLDIIEMEKQVLEFAKETGLLEEEGIDLSTLPTFAGAAQLLDSLLADQALNAVATDTARLYIDVPFKEKDIAKSLGARWDRQQKSWYVPSGFDTSPFIQWFPSGEASPIAVNEPVKTETISLGPDKSPERRFYLAVPYGERSAAKAAGALWDKETKAWYAGPKADMDRLYRWFPNNAPSHQDPAMAPKDEFSDALKQLGCIVSDPHPIMDGKKHRIAVAGDKRGENSGFYVGYLDGHPAGYIKNNRSGVEIKWKSKGYSLSPEDKAKLQAEAAAKLAERAKEQARVQELVAARLAAQLDGLLPAISTPYLDLKGVKASSGVYTDAEGIKTYIPAYDIEGKHWATQYIRKGEEDEGPFVKRFAKDCKKEGCFHPIGGFAALEAAPALVIAEGYATAKTLSDALEYATVAAFDSGNLLSVATALHVKYPAKPIIVAGDDDLQVLKTHGINPGRTKALEAATAVGGRAIFPIFAPGEQAADPARFTDFNDLAISSVLGNEAVERQIKSEVDEAIKRSKEKRLKQTREPHHADEDKRRHRSLMVG